jgi:hypothetical protein
MPPLLVFHWFSRNGVLWQAANRETKSIAAKNLAFMAFVFMWENEEFNLGGKANVVNFEKKKITPQPYQHQNHLLCGLFGANFLVRCYFYQIMYFDCL